MGRFIMLTTLILGLIGAVNAQFFGPTERSKYPVTAGDGCKPGALSVSMCPVRTECFRDSQFKNGGRCDCEYTKFFAVRLHPMKASSSTFFVSTGNPLFWMMPKDLPFNPDSEWDDGFSKEDCQEDHLSRFLSNCIYGFNFLMGMAFMYTDSVVLRELIRAKALKWNATAYSLVFLLIYAITGAAVALIYFMNNFGADRVEFWYNSRGILFFYLKTPFELIVDFEICCTWIDLYDR